jgi:UDPglucose 6-dehydrogenase
MKIGVIGLGAVGSAMRKLFPDAVGYDEPLGIGSREEINRCKVVFVCVPTPAGVDGACDTSIVEDVVRWITGPVIAIRSTVSIGTTTRLARTYGKKIVFQPEYGPAETPDHPFNDVRQVRWLVLGGHRDACATVARAWKDVYSSDIRIAMTTAETAELCKYMENAFLATKVTFCNEFFGIARALQIDYDELRELWLLDPRIGRSHTFVYSDKRGFGGKCLPKDLSAIISTANERGYLASFLRGVMAANLRFRDASVADEAPTSASGSAIPL